MKRYLTTIIIIAVGSIAAAGALYAGEVLRPCPDVSPNLFRLNRTVFLRSYGNVIVDELLVKFKAGTTSSSISATLCLVSGDIAVEGMGYTTVVLRRSWGPGALIRARDTLLHQPSVLSVDFNNTDGRLER